MNEQQYKAHWSALTGKPASEIYIPEAIRDDRPVKAGDAIRILQDRLQLADVARGDVLAVTGVDGESLRTNAPTPSYPPDAEWYFSLDGQGSGWEIVR